MTFQDIILELQRYWAAHGCAIVQPWDVEKGAGTFNAATYLRALGPEPWRAAYVEPSRRPTDGRYGNNPNRLERHHQFQVILKPSPKDVQALYLGSLKAIGIDPADHDIRFVEDNWESPTLGAWGLGWEVWCDGMEITQFTYFQQCGGFDLQPISVELTYGLERIAMYVQNVENVYDLQWVGDLSYGDIRHSDEVQWSEHNFEHADIALHLRWFDEYKDECLRLCDAGLVIPAYDYCLRSSHIFNILDARGAIGVTERQAYILRVRELAKRCAEAFLAHREALGFPLRKQVQECVELAVPALPGGDESGTGAFLLELGTEEIPASMASRAAQSLLRAIKETLNGWGIETISGEHADSTPRRLVVGFDALSLSQADRDQEIKGPPKRIAYDDSGELTRAGQAFFDKMQDGDELFTQDSDKGEYLMVRRQEKGQSTRSLLAEALPELITKLRWPKPMRWGTEKTPFVRPIHWVLCALNDQLVPFAFADVVSGLQSRGHRFHAPEPFEATTWSGLEEELAKRKVILAADKRRTLIQEAVAEHAEALGGRPVEDAALLDEVTHIVEWPVALVGSFETELLELPRQAVVTPMRVHQRYFPLEDKNGKLLPNFVVIAGSETVDPSVVARGNARVLRARLADARFFYENDLKKPLQEFLPALETRIWLAKLGSVRSKVDRIVALVKAVGGNDNAQRAALLCKADLATEMVGEFAKLQGEMGRVYAREHGESAEVADGIYEHYLPRHATDELPTTLAGTLVALADRIDSIVGCFGIGLKPTGSKDPYALRRQCIGVVNILRATNHDIPLDIVEWLDAGIAGYGDQINADCRTAILEFVADRTRFMLRETLPVDVVDAVVGVNATRPQDVYGKIDALSVLRRQGGLEPILTTFKRVANITKGAQGSQRYNPSLLNEPAECELLSSVEKSRAEVAGSVKTGAYDRAVALMAELRPLVDTFFEDVLVMAEDTELRNARLGLLVSIRDLFGGIADFSRIQDRK